MQRGAVNAVRRGLSLYYNDHVHVAMPPRHRFPMQKYFLVRSTLQKELAQRAGNGPWATFQQSPESPRSDLSLAHNSEYVNRVLGGKLSQSEVRRIGLPVEGAFLARNTTAVGGTVAAMRDAMTSAPPGQFAVAGHVAGGTHHAYRGHGEGFCVFNDIAVAAEVAKRDFLGNSSSASSKRRRVLIIDLDVHQGNGTAEIFANDPDVITFSMHCSKNIFSQREHSDHDVEIAPGIGDGEYLKVLQTWLPFLFDTYAPELVFYQAGVDPFERDQLGKLSLTRSGLQKRNSLVLQFSQKHGAKLVLTLGGGYPSNLDETSSAFRDLVECHADVYRQAAKLLSDADAL